ncbi:helix-turn-helix domain-containing protein [Streptomyces sp. NPDC021019]|uniref:helix-turn-helix domain-containing protein n=1 Tax=Streptomyces sp. NPDC021019 TaxID=3365108 RepID=UPI0037B9F69D
MADTKQEKKKERRPRRRGQEREQLRTDLAKGYGGGEGAGSSIRRLAAAHRLSYGLTRTLLLEAGVELRTRARKTETGEK